MKVCYNVTDKLLMRKEWTFVHSFICRRKGCVAMASKDSIEKLTYELLEPILQDNGFECVDVEYIKEANQWYLRVYLDKPDGITVNDCEIVSRALDKKLDEKDPIKEPYILEVSSPGLDRPLKKDKDFERHLGDMVELKLYKAIDKVKEFSGELVAYDEETLTIDIEGETQVFPRKDIAIIRLAIIF